MHLFGVAADSILKKSKVGRRVLHLCTVDSSLQAASAANFIFFNLLSTLYVRRHSVSKKSVI